jgi:hypothetical protein
LRALKDLETSPPGDRSGRRRDALRAGADEWGRAIFSLRAGTQTAAPSPVDGELSIRSHEALKWTRARRQAPMRWGREVIAAGADEGVFAFLERGAGARFTCGERVVELAAGQWIFARHADVDTIALPWGVDCETVCFRLPALASRLGGGALPIALRGGGSTGAEATLCSILNASSTISKP